jgi:hypothetical protein
LIPFIFTFGLLVFETNCLVVGGCNIYAWIKTVTYIVSKLNTMEMLIQTLFQPV